MDGCGLFVTFTELLGQKVTFSSIVIRSIRKSGKQSVSTCVCVNKAPHTWNGSFVFKVAVASLARVFPRKALPQARSRMFIWVNLEPSIVNESIARESRALENRTISIGQRREVSCDSTCCNLLFVLPPLQRRQLLQLQ